MERKNLNKRLLITLILVLLFSITSRLSAEDSQNLKNGYYFTGFAGWSHSFSDTLKIHRANGEEYEFTADYDSNAFKDYPYWAVRLEKWSQDTAFGIELIHHKVYLKNPQRTLRSLSVSDGFNILALNRTWSLKEKEFFRTGIGVVFAHPDVKFTDSKRFHRNSGLLRLGHFLSGPAMQVAYEKWIYETKRNFVTLETKLTLAYAQFPIEHNKESYARMPNIAIHFLFGIGSKPMQKNPTIKDRLYYFAPGLFPVVSNTVLGPTLHKLTHFD